MNKEFSNVIEVLRKPSTNLGNEGTWQSNLQEHNAEIKFKLQVKSARALSKELPFS